MNLVSPGDTEVPLIPAWVCGATSIIKCGKKFRIHSQTSRVQPLKLGDGYVLELKLIHVLKGAYEIPYSRTALISYLN